MRPGDIMGGAMAAIVLVAGAALVPCSGAVEAASGSVSADTVSANAGPGTSALSTTEAGTIAAPTSTAPTSTSSTTTTVPPVPEHRIGVRVGEGCGEFYDRTTGETWIPRGFNHWRWDLHDGYLMDRTFRVGANELDEAKADLAAIAAVGGAAG